MLTTWRARRGRPISSNPVKIDWCALRRYNVLGNTSDPLPYLTETPTNPNGDLTYLALMANRMLQYVKGRSA